jgi:hypothetical protein
MTAYNPPYNPPYKTLFFLCYSAVAATVATEAGLLGNPDFYVARQSHQAFVDDYESYLADNEEHPWCGTGIKGEWQIQYLMPDGDHGVRFIDKEEYETLKVKTLEEA